MTASTMLPPHGGGSDSSVFDLAVRATLKMDKFF